MTLLEALLETLLETLLLTDRAAPIAGRLTALLQETTSP